MVLNYVESSLLNVHQILTEKWLWCQAGFHVQIVQFPVVTGHLFRITGLLTRVSSPSMWLSLQLADVLRLLQSVRPAQARRRGGSKTASDRSGGRHKRQRPPGAASRPTPNSGLRHQRSGRRSWKGIGLRRGTRRGRRRWGSGCSAISRQPTAQRASNTAHRWRFLLHTCEQCVKLGLVCSGLVPLRGVRLWRVRFASGRPRVGGGARGGRNARTSRAAAHGCSPAEGTYRSTDGTSSTLILPSWAAWDCLPTQKQMFFNTMARIWRSEEEPVLLLETKWQKVFWFVMGCYDIERTLSIAIALRWVCISHEADLWNSVLTDNNPLVFMLLTQFTLQKTIRCLFCVFHERWMLVPGPVRTNLNWKTSGFFLNVHSCAQRPATGRVAQKQLAINYRISTFRSAIIRTVTIIVLL